jgi:WD40 repeat protein
VNWSPEGDKIISGSFDNVIIIWDANSGSKLGSLTGHTGSVYGAHFSPQMDRVFSCSFDRTVKVWDLDKAWGVRQFRFFVFCVAFAFFSLFALFFVVDLSLNQMNHVGHTARILSICVSPTGNKIVTASRDKTLKVLLM